jgi:acyl-CoA thioester hydrolase
MASVYETILPVLAADIDEQNHVNNTVYLRWVQQIASAHWNAIASPDAKQSISWVVLRHEIDYQGAAALGDEILLRTWVGKATRLRFERFTEIRRRRDDQCLSRARSVWVPVDRVSGRPTRVPQHLRDQFSG